MFSRRHPFLFFTLIMAAITGLSLIAVVLMVVIGVSNVNLSAFPKTHGEKVGVVEITGPIIEAKEPIRQIKQLREDQSVKAIVIRVESPGGSVGPSQEIYRELRKTISTKPVIASMGAVAASGGYYIAAGANGIMANPGTLTGSIGVIIGYTNFESLLQKIGLTPVVIKSGEFKDTGSPVRRMSDKERELLQTLVNKTRFQFVRDVAQGRGKPTAEIEPLADGRIFTGEEAKENGLVDQLGNLEDAIDWAGRMSGIKGEIAAVYAQPRELNWMRFLTDSVVHQLYEKLESSMPQAAYLYNPQSANQ